MLDSIEWNRVAKCVKLAKRKNKCWTVFNENVEILLTGFKEKHFISSTFLQTYTCQFLVISYCYSAYFLISLLFALRYITLNKLSVQVFVLKCENIHADGLSLYWLQK